LFRMERQLDLLMWQLIVRGGRGGVPWKPQVSPPSVQMMAFEDDLDF